MSSKENRGTFPGNTKDQALDTCNIYTVTAYGKSQIFHPVAHVITSMQIWTQPKNTHRAFI
jgi:hypothetical protein